MKLFVTDLDGTLLDNETHASEINMQALHNLKKQGYEIVIATGRQYRIIQTMRLQELEPYIISLNGSMIYDPKGTILYENILAKAQLQFICSTCDKLDLMYIVYTNKRMYIKYPKNFVHQLFALAKKKTKTEEELIDFLEEFLSYQLPLPPFNDESMESILSGEEIACKVEATADDATLLEALERSLEKDFCVAASCPTNREITAPNVNKGSAMEALCKHLNSTLDDCVAIGDNRNDVDMLEKAGFSIAMGNADDTIKQQCDYVSDTCVNHGVAQAIQYLLNK